MERLSTASFDEWRTHNRPLQQSGDPQRGPGSQFSSFAFTTTLRGAGIPISMDGRGRWMDNIVIERLWRSLKYECMFLNALETGGESPAGTRAHGCRTADAVT